MLRIYQTLSQSHLLLPVCLVILSVALAVAVGYRMGQGMPEGMPLATVGMINSAEAALADTGEAPPALGMANSEVPASGAELHAGSVHDVELGRMRAELVRLHGMLVRLAEIARLEDGEFDLDASPLLWDGKQDDSQAAIGLLNRQLAHISSSAEIMSAIYRERKIAYDQRVSGSPVANGRRSSGFGVRLDPHTGKRDRHRGIDFSDKAGAEIFALAAGVVTYSGPNSGYGNLVELEHVDGIRTRYAHNEANLVQRGERVAKGQVIATVGSTGKSTGPHVHVEVRKNGGAVDPALFIR